MLPNLARMDTYPMDTIAGSKILQARLRSAAAFQPDQAVMHGDRRATFIRMQDDAAIIRQLNRLAALASFTARLDWPSGEPPEAHLSPSGPGRVGVLLALLAQSAIDVLGGSGAGRLRRCEAPGCTTYYLKDHPRRAWCSPKCGNRVRVARHYQRHHRTGS